MEASIPNFLIIGSAKCGTTALASILDSHPDCCFSRPKEISYFQDTIDFQPNLNYEKGWDWYKKAFSHYNGEASIGEGTPSYSDRSRSPNTAKRIYKFNPEMRLIYMVRNPLQRQVSAWKMQYAFGKDQTRTPKTEEAWALDGFSNWLNKQKQVNQWDTTRFYWQLESYFDYFPQGQTIVSYLEDWRINKESEVRRIMSFLGLNFSKWDQGIREQRNSSTERKVPRSSVKLVLQNRYAKRLSSLLPNSVRVRLRKQLAHRSVKIPPPDIQADDVKEFLDYVHDDSIKLHRLCGKSDDFWQKQR
ncbi:MAG: sulfotransferase [Puniceicoccaceae bacterium]